MYVNLKQRTNKKNIKVFYIYVCESVRIEGKVKNTQKYFGNIKETELVNDDYTILANAMQSGKWDIKEIWKVEEKLKEKARQLKRELEWLLLG